MHVDDRKATERLHPACTTTAERLQADYEMVIRKALEALPITTKAKRLQVLWPLIEQKLLAGTSHADILRTLNDGGFDLSERTYRTYVYRFRKRQRKEAPQNQGASHSDSPARTAPSSLASRPNLDNDAPKRPATFDFDPRGIPSASRGRRLRHRPRPSAA
jgi:hypothetical protein